MRSAITTPRLGGGRLVALATLVVVVLCATPRVARAELFFPWEKKPEAYNWMVSVGPTVSFFSDPPPGATNAFFGIRFGLYLASPGDAHITEADAEQSFISTLGHHSLFRGGFPFMPDNLFLSPLQDASGLSVVGTEIRFVSIGLHPTGGWLRFGTSVGIIGSYLYIETNTPGFEETHFMQPGVDWRVDFELDWGAENFFISLAWNSMIHLPQAWGSSFQGPSQAGPVIWHIGQAILLFNFIVPNDPEGEGAQP